MLCGRSRSIQSSSCIGKVPKIFAEKLHGGFHFAPERQVKLVIIIAVIAYLIKGIENLRPFYKSLLRPS